MPGGSCHAMRCVRAVRLTHPTVLRFRRAGCASWKILPSHAQRFDFAERPVAARAACPMPGGSCHAMRCVRAVRLTHPTVLRFRRAGCARRKISSPHAHSAGAIGQIPSGARSTPYVGGSCHAMRCVRAVRLTHPTVLRFRRAGCARRKILTRLTHPTVLRFRRAGCASRAFFNHPHNTLGSVPPHEPLAARTERPMWRFEENPRQAS